MEEAIAILETGRGRFIIPSDGQFEQEGVDFIPAEDAKIEAAKLITKHSMVAGSYQVAYLWKRKGGARNGAQTMGACQKPSGLLSYFSNVDFVIWLAADHCRDLKYTSTQLEALLFHELQHIGEDPDSEKPLLVPHDFEGFRSEVEEYGFWDERTRNMATAFQMRFDMDGTQ